MVDENELVDNEPLDPSELLTEILIALVEQPDKIRVEQIQNETTIALTVHCEASDRGIVIGRQGNNIQALRVLFGHMAAKTNRRVVIEVAESRNHQRPLPRRAAS